jgi:hypothetical protein
MVKKIYLTTSFPKYHLIITAPPSLDYCRPTSFTKRITIGNFDGVSDNKWIAKVLMMSWNVPDQFTHHYPDSCRVELFLSREYITRRGSSTTHQDNQLQATFQLGEVRQDRRSPIGAA